MTSALLIERYRDSATMTSSYMLEEAKSSRDDVNNQQLSRSARTGISNDNVRSVVITFNRKLQSVSGALAFKCSRTRGHFAAECNRPKRDNRPRRDDKRTDDRYKKEERYKRDEEDDEREVDRSKDKSKEKFKERSKDRRMKTNNNKKLNRRNDRKALMAEESTKSWADSDSETSSTSSSSSDSEQEEVHCFMANHTDDDEVFDFANSEFTREDLVQALNDMVHEYKTPSHTFEEIKSENASLKNSSAKSSSDELEDTDSLKTELSRLKIENELLRNEASELKAEVDKLTEEMSSWNKAIRSLYKLYESQKPLNDKTGVGFIMIAALEKLDARASGNTALSSPCWDLLAAMHRVVNYHSQWARQRQVQLFDASRIRGTQVLQLVVVLTQLEVPMRWLEYPICV
ncbi:hypothetical protein F511_31990 [Dorcoceras hygrometricum]|uniref:Uncharacterized protein n=1 Tax=Dorcoceras hygrometricum TaxID=472368 RepID=A0A2Z7CM46_9LAMI|nr:hypothetical protein F511_31990 [Dorcoceras hygrometricum]